MEIVVQAGGVLATGLRDFNLAHIFDCGQCFRWEPDGSGGYTGLIGRLPLRVSESDGGVLFEHCTSAQFRQLVVPYFDLERDYGAVKRALSREDRVLREATDFGYGIRILRQNPWEMIASFIISQRNSIPKIKRVIALLCEKFGDEISWNGKKYYTFPPPNRLCGLMPSDLAFLRCGYRDRYILDAAQKVQSGAVDPQRIADLPYAKAKAELKTIMGVGEKVAQCILLFGFHKFEAFPVDTWILKAMQQRYHITEREIEAFAGRRFQNLSGFAQQYLFYCEREHGFSA